MKIPFGIVQIGKTFRNEIAACQFIFRMCEFKQMKCCSTLPNLPETPFTGKWP